MRLSHTSAWPRLYNLCISYHMDNYILDPGDLEPHHRTYHAIHLRKGHQSHVLHLVILRGNYHRHIL